MSNRGLQIIWVSIKTLDGRKIRLYFPMSLYVFREILDCILDLLTLTCLFVPKDRGSVSRFSVHAGKEVTRMLIGFTGSLTDDGPYDLVDVTTQNAKVCIKIR